MLYLHTKTQKHRYNESNILRINGHRSSTTIIFIIENNQTAQKTY